MIGLAAGGPAAAPWWVTSIVGLVGVIVGLLGNSWLDSRATRSRERRDDSLRFIQDKRVAYADLLASCAEVADAEHISRQLEARNLKLDKQATVTDDESDDYNRDLLANRDRRTEAYRDLNRAMAIVELIAPEQVVEAAGLYVSRTHLPHLMTRRVEAESAYVDAARSDLGYRPTGHLPGYEFEPYLGALHPESGIDAAE